MALPCGVKMSSSDIKKMADVQIAFFRQLCRLKRSVTPAIIFRELSEMPWVHRWWNQVIGFMHRLSNMPEESVHAEVLRDNIADAQERERENFTSPFSQHWLMRTRLCWSHQPH